MYSHEKEPSITGYRAWNQLEVTVSPQRAGELIDRSVEAGANQIYGVSFKLSDEKQDELKTEVLKEAVGDAESKARAIAQAIGGKLGKPVKITESSYSIPGPVYMTRERLEATATTPVEPGEVEVSARVSIEYTFE